VAVCVSHAVKNNTLITFNTIYKMQQILWETADNEISVQKCDVYLATALKKVNNRSILYIPCCKVMVGFLQEKKIGSLVLYFNKHRDHYFYNFYCSLTKIVVFRLIIDNRIPKPCNKRLTVYIVTTVILNKALIYTLYFHVCMFTCCFLLQVYFLCLIFYMKF
jgi:hypothetical protein